MKVIIAGSRTLSLSVQELDQVVQQSGFEVTELISGGAAGMDQAGEAWARSKGIPIRQFLPDWEKHGKAAGPIRNREMVKNSEAVIAVWDGESKGTKSTIVEAQKRGQPVHLYTITKEDKDESQH